MSISIIIPTKNAESYIRNLLDLISNQTIEFDEIIIIDTASNDKTIEICKNYGNVKLIQINQNDFDHGGTRNFAAKHANGEFLVFLTQDALPQNEHFLENLLKPFENPKVSAVYGRQVARDDATPIEKFTRDFNYPDADIIKSKADIDRLGIKAFFFTNVCSAFRRTDFNSVGGFPDHIILNEDMIIASKLLLKGKLIAYSSKAVVIHSHNYSFRQQFMRYFDIGVCFKMNHTILKYAKAEKEGNRFVKKAIINILRNSNPLWVFKFIIESAFKFAGYRLGLNYNMLSKKSIIKFSMHKHFWDRVNSI